MLMARASAAIRARCCSTWPRHRAQATPEAAWQMSRPVMLAVGVRRSGSWRNSFYTAQCRAGSQRNHATQLSNEHPYPGACSAAGQASSACWPAGAARGTDAHNIVTADLQPPVRHATAPEDRRQLKRSAAFRRACPSTPACCWWSRQAARCRRRLCTCSMSAARLCCSRFVAWPASCNVSRSHKL